MRFEDVAILSDEWGAVHRDGTYHLHEDVAAAVRGLMFVRCEIDRTIIAVFVNLSRHLGARRGADRHRAMTRPRRGGDP